MKVSNCCGYEIGDPHFIDIGICPACKEHCDFEEVCVEEEEKQKTALMELIAWINDFDPLIYPKPEYIIDKATELLQKERQQIEESFDDGFYSGKNRNYQTLADNGADYYNKTYKQ